MSKVLRSMFTERIGTSFLDSGGAYGYNFQRNKKRNLAKEPAATLEVSYHEPGQYNPKGSLDFNLEVNTYQWLDSRLEYSKNWNAKFHRFAKRPEFENSYWGEIIEAWFEHLQKQYDVTGVYGEGEPWCVNTYNHENILDQTIQFTIAEVFEKDCSEIRTRNALAHLCVLEVNGGFDVRGGYTVPRVFEVTGYDGIVEMLNYDRASIGCDKGHNWYTDDAYHFYGNGDKEEWVEENILFGDVTHIIPVKDFAEYEVADFDFTPKEEGSHYGTAHCPVCKAMGQKVPLERYSF